MDSMSLTTVDMAVLAAVALSGLIGFYRGLASELHWLVAVGGGWFLALRTGDTVAAWLGRYVSLAPDTTRATAYLLVGTVVLAAVLITHRLLGKAVQVVVEPRLSRYGGLAAGILKGVFAAAFVVAVADRLPSATAQAAFAPPSVVGPALRTLQRLAGGDTLPPAYAPPVPAQPAETLAPEAADTTQ